MSSIGIGIGFTYNTSISNILCTFSKAGAGGGEVGGGVDRQRDGLEQMSSIGRLSFLLVGLAAGALGTGQHQNDGP